MVSDVRGLDLQEGHSESLAAGAGDGSTGEGRMSDPKQPEKPAEAPKVEKQREDFMQDTSHPRTLAELLEKLKKKKQ